MVTHVIQVVTTTANRGEAQRIADALVEQRLAACVQVGGPIISTYRWQGNIEHSDEWLCTIKTVQRLYPRIEQTIRDMHSYDEPEILAVPVVAGSDGYMKWLNEQVSESKSPDEEQ